MSSSVLHTSARGLRSRWQPQQARSMRLLLVLLVLGLTSDAFAQLEQEQSVEVGREVLQRQGFPWYDAEQDKLRRIDVAPQEETAGNRKSKWESQPRQLSPFRQRFWQGLLWLLERLVWVLLAIVLAVLVYLAVRAFLRAEAAAATDSSSAEDELRGQLDRVENLPFPVRRPQADLLAEAQRLYEAGQYEEAMIYFYSYLLVQLDKHQVIHLTRGKTNRQYLRELRRRPELARLLEFCMGAFEDVFFGRHSLSRERFEACWRQLDRFHEQVNQVAA